MGGIRAHWRIPRLEERRGIAGAGELRLATLEQRMPAEIAANGSVTLAASSHWMYQKNPLMGGRDGDSTSDAVGKPRARR